MRRKPTRRRETACPILPVLRKPITSKGKKQIADRSRRCVGDSISTRSLKKFLRRLAAAEIPRYDRCTTFPQPFDLEGTCYATGMQPLPPPLPGKRSGARGVEEHGRRTEDRRPGRRSLPLLSLSRL